MSARPPTPTRRRELAEAATRSAEALAVTGRWGGSCGGAVGECEGAGASVRVAWRGRA